MSSLPARTGRHKQRYKDQLRLVAGCIPFRFEKNCEDHSCSVENRLRVLMISTPNRDDLVFPKGGWENDETMSEAACREAWEEAGVKGILGEKPLGEWEFRSKSKQSSCSLTGGCRGFMYSLKVTEEFDIWPEKSDYGRKWLTIGEALEFCRYDWMREALQKFLTVLSEDIQNKTKEELLEFPVVPLVDTQADCPKLSSGWFDKPSGVQHYDESRTNCAVQG